MANLPELMENDFTEKVEDADKPVVIDFFAEWCGPCKKQGPILEEILNEADGNYNVFKVDVDKNNSLASRFSVMSIPTVIVFKNGEPSKTFIGLTPKEKILEAIK